MSITRRIVPRTKGCDAVAEADGGWTHGRCEGQAVLGFDVGEPSRTLGETAKHRVPLAQAATRGQRSRSLPPTLADAECPVGPPAHRRGLCEDIGHGIRKPWQHAAPIKGVIQTQGLDLSLDVAGLPDINLTPLRPDDPHQLRPSVEV